MYKQTSHHVLLSPPAHAHARGLGTATLHNRQSISIDQCYSPLPGGSSLQQGAAIATETHAMDHTTLFCCFESLFRPLPGAPPHRAPTLRPYFVVRTLLSLVTGRWACFSNLIALTVRSSPHFPLCLCSLFAQSLCTDRIMIAHTYRC